MASKSSLLPPLSDQQLRSSSCGLTRAERADQTAVLLQRAAETTDPAQAEALRARVVLMNRGVAEAVARRYHHRGVGHDDLVQVAYEGLTKAVTRFEPALRNDFLTFAVPTIRGELQRYFRDHGWTVRPPRWIQELQGRAHTAVRELEQVLGREPTDDEVAEALGVPAENYREAVAALGCFQPTSLDLPVGTETATLVDLLPAEGAGDEASEARVMLEPALRCLSARDQHILKLRFADDLTQAEIGDELGVTQMQVSRLLARILRDLRQNLAPTAAAI